MVAFQAQGRKKSNKKCKKLGKWLFFKPGKEEKATKSAINLVSGCFSSWARKKKQQKVQKNW